MANEAKLRKKIQKKDKDLSNTITKSEPEEKVKSHTSPYKYGPMPRFSGQRIFSRGVIIVGVLLYVWFYSKGTKESILAKQDTIYHNRGQWVECNKEYLDEVKQYRGCIPKKCGRFVNDQIITENEADILLWLAKRGMALGGSEGGATIMDLHSGALSYKENFINFYRHPKSNFVTETDLIIYKNVREKIQQAIAQSFGIDLNNVHLTHPTFFSRLTSNDPVTAHDEYWHIHVDKHTYESFHYTSLLYLNDFNKDFKGGRFIYLDNLHNPRSNVSVEPRKARVSMFTSGAENPHYVERVTEGERYAITISFTCNESKKISDPVLKNRNSEKENKADKSKEHLT